MPSSGIVNGMAWPPTNHAYLHVAFVTILIIHLRVLVGWRCLLGCCRVVRILGLADLVDALGIEKPLLVTLSPTLAFKHTKVVKKCGGIHVSDFNATNSFPALEQAGAVI